MNKFIALPYERYQTMCKEKHESNHDKEGINKKTYQNQWGGLQDEHKPRLVQHRNTFPEKTPYKQNHRPRLVQHRDTFFREKTPYKQDQSSGLRLQKVHEPQLVHQIGIGKVIYLKSPCWLSKYRCCPLYALHA